MYFAVHICWERILIQLLSLIFLTTESGSSVLEQWARYPHGGRRFDPRSDSNQLKQTLDESMDPDLEIPSRIQDPSMKPLQPLYVDIWASLLVNMTILVRLTPIPIR